VPSHTPTLRAPIHPPEDCSGRTHLAHLVGFSLPAPPAWGLDSATLQKFQQGTFVRKAPNKKGPYPSLLPPTREWKAPPNLCFQNNA